MTLVSIPESDTGMSAKNWTRVLAHFLILASLFCKRIYKDPINVGDINALCQYPF